MSRTAACRKITGNLAQAPLSTQVALVYGRLVAAARIGRRRLSVYPAVELTAMS